MLVEIVGARSNATSPLLEGSNCIEGIVGAGAQWPQGI